MDGRIATPSELVEEDVSVGNALSLTGGRQQWDDTKRAWNRKDATPTNTSHAASINDFSFATVRFADRLDFSFATVRFADRLDFSASVPGARARDSTDFLCENRG
jgi:hypothetical protein